MSEVKPIFQKKLGPKQLVGDVRKLCEGKKDGDIFPLYRIFGIANGVRSGTSQYGDWFAFVGTFEGLVLSDGGEVKEIHQSGQAFLHEPIQGMLIGALKTNDAVEFVVDVSCRVDSSLPRGYEYIETPIVKAQQADALASLRQAALPAPKDAVETKAKKTA